MSWDDMGRNSRSAAQSLKPGHPRSSVSRAYYAAFAVLNERLIPHQAPRLRFEAHLHREVPNLIEQYLSRDNAKVRRALRTTIVRLYNARLDADYKQSRTVDEATSLNALRDAKAIFEMLGVADA